MAFTFIVEDGSNVANANSYVDLQEAKDYQEALIHSPAEWGAADDTSKQKALVNATTLIGAYFSFPGMITYEDQSLYWPRTGVRKSGKFSFAEDEMPKALRQATAHLAGLILQADITAPTGTEGLKKLGLGKGALDLEFTEGHEAKAIAKIVAAMLKGIATWMESTSRVVELRRV